MNDYYRYKKLRAAIVGASGYAGTELLRLLLDHPDVTVTALYVSEQSADAGKLIYEIDGRLCNRTDLRLKPLSDPEAAADNVEIVFLATEHEVSAQATLMTLRLVTAISQTILRKKKPSSITVTT